MGPGSEEAQLAEAHDAAAPGEASVVIVGGGIAGCSLAYQLCALGVDGAAAGVGEDEVDDVGVHG